MLPPASVSLGINLGRRAVAQCLVNPFVTVEAEVSRQIVLRLPAILVVLQIDFLVLHAPPEPFYKHIVERPPATIHADRHAARCQAIGECHRSELAPLIGIEYLGLFY